MQDGEATRTIENADLMPAALLARFGRATAEQVVQHIEERMAAPRERGFRSRFAGQELRSGSERDFVLGFLSQSPMGNATAEPGYAPSGNPHGGGMFGSMFGGGDLFSNAEFDPLPLQDVERLGRRPQARQKRQEGFSQAQMRGTIVGLFHQSVPLALQLLLALTQQTACARVAGRVIPSPPGSR